MGLFHYSFLKNRQKISKFTFFSLFNFVFCPNIFNLFWLCSLFFWQPYHPWVLVRFGFEAADDSRGRWLRLVGRATVAAPKTSAALVLGSGDGVVRVVSADPILPSLGDLRCAVVHRLEKVLVETMKTITCAGRKTWDVFNDFSSWFGNRWSDFGGVLH